MKWFKKKNKKIDSPYVSSGAKKIKEEDFEEVLKRRQEIEDKIKDSKGLSKYIEVVRQLFSMLNDVRLKNYTAVPWTSISTMVFIILYVLMPMDLIPDFIPFVGYLDDMTVLAIGLNLIEPDLEKYLKWKAEQEFPKNE